MELIIPKNEKQNQEIGLWASNKLGLTIYLPYMAVGVAKDQNSPLVGAAVFNHYNGFNIEITAYGPRAFTPSVVKSLMKYVFEQLGCIRLSARTKRSNIVTRKLLGKHAKFETTLKRYYGSEDAFLFCVFKENWLEKKNGKFTKPARAA